MAKYEIQDDQGRKVQIEIDGEVTPEIAAQAFASYDAIGITQAGPRGSEGRRRAQAGVAARNAQDTVAEISGGSTAGPVLSGLSSAARAASDFGLNALTGLGRAASGYVDVVGGALAGNLRPEDVEASTILARSEENPLVKAGTSLRDQSQAFYPVNPKQAAANLAGSALGSIVGTVAAGPLAVPAYALSSGEAGLQEALAAGATPDQAIQQGMFEAGTGAATEGVLGVVPGLREAKAGAMRGIVRPTLKSTIGEAVQEPLEGALNRASAKYVTGSDPTAQPLDPETLAMEAAGGAIGGAAAGGAFGIANARDRANRLAAIQEYRSPEATILRQVENAPLSLPQNALVMELPSRPAATPPPGIQQFDGMSSADILGQVQRRLDQKRMVAAVPARQFRSQAWLNSGIETLPSNDQVQTPIDQFAEAEAARRAETIRAQAIQEEAARARQQSTHVELATNPISTPLLDSHANETRANQVAQTGSIPDVVRIPSVTQAEGQAPQRTPLQASEDPQVATAVKQVQEPASFNSIDDLLKFRESRLSEERALYKEQIGLNDTQAERLQYTLSGNGGTERFESKLTPEQKLKFTQFFDGPFNQKSNPFQTWEMDSRIDPSSVASETDKNMLASTLVAAVERGFDEKVNNDRFVGALVAAHKLRELGATKADIARYLDGYTTRNSSSQGDKAEYFTTLGKSITAFLEKSGVNLDEGSVTPTQPTGARLRKSPLRSEPAAAQSIATSGAGTTASPTVAPAIEESVFSVRPYRGAPTITKDTYNRINEAIDSGIAKEDPVAKQIRDLDADAESGVKKAAGYETLSEAGKFEATQLYRNKLYQAATKWADTGKFTFNQSTIAKSVAMDVGKRGAERLAQKTSGEEAVGESGTDTNLTRATTQVIPKTRIQPDTNRVKQDAVSVIQEIQARLRLSNSEIVNIISAYQSDTTADLNDKELAAYDAAKPTLDKIGATNFSVSALISEPIGQVRAQEAVDNWLDLVGNPELLIRVVDDPKLKTPDGRNVAAQIEFSQGGQPIITINGAHIGSEAEVAEKIWHELLHTTWEDPEVQRTWGELTSKLSEADVRAQLARGYSPLEATMEAAIDAASIRAANTPIRPAWQRFLDSIWQALKKAFGFQSKPANFEALMISALRAAAGPWNGQQQSGDTTTRYSVANNLYVTQPERFKRIAEQGQTEAVVAQGQTASAIIPESTLKEISDLEAKPNPTPAERSALTHLKGVRNIVGTAVVADQIRQANEGNWPNYRTLDDLPEQYKSVAAQSVMATHLYLNQRYNNLKARQNRVASQIADIASKLDGLNESRLLAHVSNNEADQLLKDLQTMIDLEIGKVGTSAASRTLDELHKASAAVVELRQKQDAISAALRSIAKEAPMADFASPEAMKSWVESRQSDKSKPQLMTDEVATAIRASLKPGSGLPDRLSLIRALMADAAVAKAQIKELKAKVVNPKTALKTIIALKMDASSVLNQVAKLDRSLDRQLVQLDGLDAAIGVMDRMQESKQYRARVESAFQYGGFKYSGIIRYTNKPNGDQTLVGPSGKEYVVNFTPDFAVEKKNLDTIGEWMAETSQAVNDPNIITDPAKRTSYANSLAFVTRYMTDRRWLSESAWEDSAAVSAISAPLMLMEKAGILKAALGDHMDTRFNAYRAMAGRAGSELVKRSRATDTFGSKAKLLTYSMKEPLATARRKAVESHGFNPDDAADLAVWNRKVNSWILSQNQNPGSTPVKVGDSLGEGLLATKEDMVFAEMQHKFSRAIGEIYSGSDVEGGTKDPESPGLSPEEQLFGLDFSRKAMQYGYAVGRQFSEAGQEHTREWMAARAKDLAEYKDRVSKAAEGEEVPMVWAERAKVADADIEGHVYSHIRESSTDYASTADKQSREAYREIAKSIRRGIHYATLNDISEALAPLLSTETEEGVVEVGASQAKESLLKALDKDVLNYNRVAELVTQPSNDPTVSDLPKALAAVRSAKGALVKARGKMAAPSFFYDYSLDTDAKRAGMVQMGKQALHISEINAARNMLSAMRAKLAEYDTKIEARSQEIGRNGKKVGTWSATRELEAKLRKQFKAGELQITYSMLKRTADKLETLSKDLEESLARQRVLEEEAFKVALLNFSKGAVASVLLSMPAPIINNMTAVALDPLRLGLMHGNIGLAMGMYGTQLGSSIKYIFQRTIYKMAKKMGLAMPRKVQEAIADLSSRLFSEMLEHRQELEDSGNLDAAEPFTAIWNRYAANPLSFGDTTRGKETATSRAISGLLTSTVLGRGLVPATFEYIRQRFPGSGDRMVNHQNAKVEKILSDRLKLKLWLWVNSLEGSTPQEKALSASSASIKASDIKMSEENLSNYRTTYDPTGSLERLAADYYLRNPDGAKGDLLTPAQRDAVVFELISLTNKEVDSTRAEITKGGSGMAGAARSALYLFQRYALQLLGNQRRTFGKKAGGGWEKEFGQAMAYLLMIAMTLFTGASVLPLKQIARQYLQNEPLTSPTIAQVAENPELAGKYLTAAAGGVMPIGATLVGAMLSGQPLMGPVSANILDNNPLVGAANNVIGAAKSAYESGDLVYPALDFARKQVWFSQPLINTLMPGDAASREAKRAVRTGAVGMEVRESGGAPATVKSTPMTPIVRDAVAAIYEKDDAKFQAAKQRGIDYLVGKGLSTKEAEKRFTASISGRDPFRSVLGTNPTEEQVSTIIGRSSPGQASTLRRAREGFSLRKKSKSKGLKLRRGRSGSSRLRRARKPARLRKSSLG